MSRRDVVVGVDGSALSSRALELALREGQLWPRRVRAVTAWSVPLPLGDLQGTGYGAWPSSTDLEAAAQQTLDQALAPARCEPASYDVVGEVWEGAAEDVLVRAGKDAALLVVGSHGHGYVVNAILGSTTGYVLHHATCPVLVVPDGDGPVAPLRRVVVGMDDAPASRSALQWGADAARRHGCPLLVLHAWSPSSPPGTSALTADRDDEPAAARWLTDEVRSLPDVSTQVVTGPASGVLLAAAGPDDLLVLGTRGRGGFASLLLGSTATQCAQHARGPVVVVHADEERLDG